MPPSMLKKMFVILNFVVLSFLWDGNSDIYCRTTAKLLRSGNEGNADGEVDSFLENSLKTLKKDADDIVNGDDDDSDMVDAKHVVHDEDDVHGHLHPTRHHGSRIGAHHIHHEDHPLPKVPPSHHIDDHHHKPVKSPTRPKKKSSFKVTPLAHHPLTSGQPEREKSPFAGGFSSRCRRVGETTFAIVGNDCS